MDGAADFLERGGMRAPEIEKERVRPLHAKIVELAMANDYLSIKFKPVPGSRGAKCAIKSHPRLSVGLQCRLLSILRSSFHYELVRETAMNLGLMVVIDEQFLETPFYGVHQMTWHLHNEDHAVTCKRIRGLVRFMRLMPFYVRPDTRCFLTLACMREREQAWERDKTYPNHLVGGLRVDWPNQIWCAAITYLPMRRGFLYLVAIMNGLPGKCWLGGSRPRWKPTSAWRR